MKVLVVGAAGRTGQAVVERAVAQGHQVTAFIRSDRGYNVPGVEVRTGDASNLPAMDAAVTGQDAVIDTVAGKTPYRRTTLETDVATTIVTAMQQHGVRRLVVTSSIGVGDSIANTTLPVRIFVATYLRASTPDKAAMEAVVRGSGLEWIVTRPAALNDRLTTGDVRVLSASSHEKARSITRTDLAAFLVDQLTTDDHLRQAVTLAN